MRDATVQTRPTCGQLDGFFFELCCELQDINKAHMRAHFGLNTLLHVVVLGDLAHVGVDERVRLAHRELVLRDVK